MVAFDLSERRDLQDGGLVDAPDRCGHGGHCRANTMPALDEDDLGPASVSLLITCAVDVVAPEVGEAAVRLLRASGCTVTCDLSQTCCGQPAWNAGFAEEAATVARTTLRALETELGRGADVVVVPAGSCATMVRAFWPELFEIVGDVEAAERARRVGERTRELTELLAERAEALPDLRLWAPKRITLHHSCHLTRELHLTGQPEQLLGLVEGCDLVEWSGADRCCGFGGTFSTRLPDASVALTDEKLRAVGAVGADLVAGCDTSCLLHMRTRSEAVGTPIQIRHVAQVLHDALPAGAGRPGA
jgi:L-lactate dehydrogenase complex protein LldE